MKRRDFLKLGALSVLYPLKAYAIPGVLPGLIGGAASSGGTGTALGTTWENWDEASESSLAASDKYVCFFENTNAGGDETGQGGGLSGADLVLSESGNVAGASGTPPRRQLDGADDKFLAPDNLVKAMLVGEDWTIIVKTYIGTPNSLDYWFVVQGQGGSPELFARRDETSASVEVTAEDKDGNRRLNNVLLGDPGSAAVRYIYMWSSSSDNVTRSGFTTGKADKWSDFSNRTSTASSTNLGSSTDWGSLATSLEFGDDLSSYWYYVVLSNTCLIDNNS